MKHYVSKTLEKFHPNLASSIDASPPRPTIRQKKPEAMNIIVDKNVKNLKKPTL